MEHDYSELTLDALPHEALYHITSFFGLKDVITISTVSKDWYNRIQDNSIWKMYDRTK